MFHFAATALLAVLVSVSGCSTTPEDPPVEVRLVDLQLGHATVLETTARVVVRVENLTPDPIRVTGASHVVTVNGIRLGRAQGAVDVPVDRLGSATHELEVHLGNVSLARILDSIARTGVLDYQLRGTVYLRDARGRDRSVRIDRTGQVDARSLGLPAGTTSGGTPR